MRAPKIHVVVGVNRESGNLIAWYFDEQEARGHVDRLNKEAGDDYAYKHDDCEAGDPMPVKGCCW